MTMVLVIRNIKTDQYINQEGEDADLQQAKTFNSTKAADEWLTKIQYNTNAELELLPAVIEFQCSTSLPSIVLASEIVKDTLKDLDVAFDDLKGTLDKLRKVAKGKPSIVARLAFMRSVIWVSVIRLALKGRNRDSN